MEIWSIFYSSHIFQSLKNHLFVSWECVCLLAIKKLLDISNTSTHTHTHAQAHVMYAVGKKVATSIFGMDMEKFCV